MVLLAANKQFNLIIYSKHDKQYFERQGKKENTEKGSKIWNGMKIVSYK